MTELAGPVPKPGAGVVVVRGDEVLLIKRGKPPRMGDWSIPGGRQEPGETIRECALREVKEETGLDVELAGLVDAVDIIVRDDDGVITMQYMLADFAARWAGGEAVAGGDAASVHWVAHADVPSLGLWSETVRVIDEAVALVKEKAARAG